VKGSTVRVENAGKRFGQFHALANVSLEIKKGEFFSLLGPSGCGKTTLLRIIAGFEMPSDGVVYIDDLNVIPLPPNKRHVNTVFQNYALFPHLTAFENIAFPLRLKKLAGEEIRRKVNEYLALVKLEEHGNKMPSQLSGGQKQRVSIARALINEPSVLLLDEPLSALDAKLRQQLLIELDMIHDKIGITFIYVTHDQVEALSVSDRVAVMDKGRVLQIGTPAAIYEQPADMFVAQFIGETNVYDCTVRSLGTELTTLDCPGIGALTVTTERELKPGDRVKMTIRPEKIRVSKNEPVKTSERNILKGNVGEVIYHGSQSKLFIDLPNKVPVKVLKHHLFQAYGEPEIHWKDDVYLWWHARDAYIVEVERG
jgi:spermidine/putrescine transport system ATP-binding protein